jgi:hypothetical protein
MKDNKEELKNWFAELLKKYKNDPVFLKEQDIFNLMERSAMKRKLNKKHK